MANNITLKEIKNNKKIEVLVNHANDVLEHIGYTEHGRIHVGYVSKVAGDILEMLEYDTRTIELARIAGWIHDIGNAINRKHHGMNGALLLYPLLTEMGMDMEEIAVILSAVGNHEEETGTPVSPVSAALIIADKSDAHRTRVRRGKYDPFDIHDRVNYSIKENKVTVDFENKEINYEMSMDDSSSVMEYLQIFLTRMIMCEKAADFLGCKLNIVINGTIINNGIKQQ
jgi:metal-dependent HD superfamily phosphatase/phosphodiesterase